MTPVSYIHEDQYCATCNGSQDPSSSLLKKADACRYYQAGNCRRGSGCPFAHVAQIESPTTPHTAYLSGEHVYPFYPLGTPVYRPLGSQAHPLFLWQPYTPFSPSFDPRYGLASQTENPSDYPDDKSDPSSAESSSTSMSVEYQLRMPFDTAWLEGVDLGTSRGVASPPGDLGANLSPAYAGYGYPGFPGVQTECMAGENRPTSGQYLGQGSMVALPSPTLVPWQRDPRKKPLAYKSKPCKFHAANGKCTSGEKCTFIHDPESKGNAKKPPPKLLPGGPPTDARLPPKPRDKYEDCRSRDFYPIAWRVIGGGVMMGGQRQICPAFTAGHCKFGNDCKLAHETQLETDQVGFIEPRSELVQRDEASPPQLTKDTPLKRVQVRANGQRKSAKVPFAETPAQPEIVPSTTPHPKRFNLPALRGGEAARKKQGHEVVVLSAPASPVHRRTRSMSTAPLTHSSYAAE
ncbi:hypothetical protein L210DRAFT_3759375, partial [Boletus edulis BED1]